MSSEFRITYCDGDVPCIRTSSASCEKAHQPTRSQVGIQDRTRFSDAFADGLGGEVAGTSAAFHRRWPAGRSPVASQEAVGPGRKCGWARRVDTCGSCQESTRLDYQT